MQRLALHGLVLFCYVLGPTPALASTTVLTAEVLFPFESATASDNELAKLQRLVCLLDGREVDVIVAVGHASTAERQATSLSRARAETILRRLHTLGLPSARMRGDGKGNVQPVVLDDSAEGGQRNRRAEVEIISWYDGKEHDTECK
jgi:outer membrane protein OmpA-like peptidoglycan-associated protein